MRIEFEGSGKIGDRPVQFFVLRMDVGATVIGPRQTRVYLYGLLEVSERPLNIAAGAPCESPVAIDFSVLRAKSNSLIEVSQGARQIASLKIDVATIVISLNELRINFD